MGARAGADNRRRGVLSIAFVCAIVLALPASASAFTWGPRVRADRPAPDDVRLVGGALPVQQHPRRAGARDPGQAQPDPGARLPLGELPPDRAHLQQPPARVPGPDGLGRERRPLQLQQQGMAGLHLHRGRAHHLLPCQQRVPGQPVRRPVPERAATSVACTPRSAVRSHTTMETTTSTRPTRWFARAPTSTSPAPAPTG